MHGHEGLDGVIRRALEGTFADLRNPQWIAREREIVSLFVLSHLVTLCDPVGTLRDPGQIGIEVAVPQIKTPTNPRKDPDVCKDIVIWPRPKMTCWKIDGSKEYPLSVIEWKSVNRWGASGQRRIKTSEHTADIGWLEQTAKLASAAGCEFVGYAVLVIQEPESPSLSCARVTAATTQTEWLRLR